MEYEEETAKVVTEEGQKALRQMIYALMQAGEDMTDAAQTCGHDEALDEWNKATKKAKKLIDYNKNVKEFEIEEQRKEKERHDKKEKAYMSKREKELLEDAEILKSYGF